MARKGNGRVVYHVTPNASAKGWLVVEENGGHRAEHRTKKEALDQAKGLAQKHDLSQIKVHKKDGNMQYESTYGQDPERYPS